MTMEDKERGSELSAEASKRRTSFLVEFFSFARANKRWWMIPIVVLLLLVAGLLVLGSSGVGALIYPLF
jgi:hypothetical protein